MSAILLHPGVTLSRKDHTITVAGLGVLAAELQDRYAKTFERALLGVMNEEVTVTFQE